MPTACDISSAGGDQTQNHYAPKHNPALNFDDVAGTWNGSSLTPSAECTNQDIPAGTTGPNNMDSFNAALRDVLLACRGLDPVKSRVVV